MQRSWSSFNITQMITPRGNLGKKHVTACRDQPAGGRRFRPRGNNPVYQLLAQEGKLEAADSHHLNN